MNKSNIDAFYINKIFILSGKNRYMMIFLIFMFILLSFFDLLSIGLIGTYIALLLDSQFFNDLEHAKYIYGAIYAWNNLINIDALSISLGIFLIIIFFTKTILSIFIYAYIFKFSHIQQKSLRERLLESYRTLSYQEYSKRNSSEYVSTVGVFVKNYGTLLQVFLQSSGEILVALTLLVFLIFFDWSILLVMLTIFTLSGYFYKIAFVNYLHTYGQMLNEGYKKMYQTIQEYFFGFKELRILNSHEFFKDQLVSSTEKIAISDMRQSLISIAPRFLLELLLVFFVVLIVIVTFSSGGDIQESIPIITIFSMAGIRLAPIANTLIRLIGILKYSKDAVDKIYNDLNLDTEISYSLDNQIIKTEKSSLENRFRALDLNNIVFSYSEKSQRVLDGISLEIKRGDKIAIIGDSGSGKTTLLDVILGLLRIQSGSLKYNGEEMDDKIFHHWNSQIAYLPQEVFISNSSLKSNIALGIKENMVDEERVMDALKKANIFDLVNKLSHGIDTIIGERGVNLSGGQRQRISIARAIYHNRDILILDEATNALDYATENKILNEIINLDENKSIIFISHRLETSKNFDKVFNLTLNKYLD